MQKRTRSNLSQIQSETKVKGEVYDPPLDVLTVKILSLRLSNQDCRRHAIKVAFMDQLILFTTIRPIWARDKNMEKVIAKGKMSYDPSDYGKMSYCADKPLNVRIQPAKYLDPVLTGIDPTDHSSLSLQRTSSSKTDDLHSPVRSAIDISCCNVDILELFQDVDKMRIKKRLQPLIDPTTLQLKSWDNLPLITMELEVKRNPLNAHHHKILKNANLMSLTLIAAHNIIVPYNSDFSYTAASKTPLSYQNAPNLLTFHQGQEYPRRFEQTAFYPEWESLKSEEEAFKKGDAKVAFDIQEIQNDGNINLDYYLTHIKPHYSVVWGSFRRSLLVAYDDRRLWKQLRYFQWPLEFHIYGDNGGYSFMGFMDLFRLLYPGETTVRLAVPLHWVNSAEMMNKCGCEMLLMPNLKEPVTDPTAQTHKTKAPISTPTSTSTDIAVSRPTGADEGCAFVLVEVRLARPLVKPTIPPHIPESEIKQMLGEIENLYRKPVCTGRGQLIRDWQATIRSAANSLRRVPYYGVTEFCAFNRQLSETRTRVELTTSCWLDAAVYVNNNFVVQNYLQSDTMFEEMLMMAHACLLRDACTTLVGAEVLDLDPTLRAARHARHLQDIPHAMELYLQLVTEGWYNASSWRELSTCLRDVDGELADVCINNAVCLEPRHPLTLLAKGSHLYESDPESAELFFSALLALYPFWTTGWVAAQAFYIERQEFYMADQIMELLRKTQADALSEDLGAPRAWEKELGDWWDHTPLLPGMSRYFDAADLLLRLRAMALAEVCLGRALSDGGESAAYAHLVALSCRLRGDVDNAMCHLQGAIEAFGEISYLRSLEAECFQKLGKREEALTAFEKSGNTATAYSTLTALPCRDPHRTRSVLVDLLRRQPSAYAWMKLADDWMMRQAAATGEAGDGAAEAEVAMTSCAAACAVQALKWDRRCARAWATLARHVRPKARRFHCRDMAAACGYNWTEEQLDSLKESQLSLCYRVAQALKECQCDLCNPIKF